MISVSPGVATREIDLTAGVPPFSTTEGAIAGLFRWGPVNKVHQVFSEQDLVKKYIKPSAYNAETWFCAANFLAYSNNLYVCRALGDAVSSVANTGEVANLEIFTILNEDDYDSKKDSFSGDTDVLYIAKYPGQAGNSLRIAVCDSPSAYRSNVNLVVNDSIEEANITISPGSNIATISLDGGANATVANLALASIANTLTTGDLVAIGNASIGTQSLKLSSLGTFAQVGNIATLTLNFDNISIIRAAWSSSVFTRSWEFSTIIGKAPGQSPYVKGLGALANSSALDELHVVVVDSRGTFGVPEDVLEVFQGLSRVTGARTPDGSDNYYNTALNLGSAYVWFANDRAGAASNTPANIATSTNIVPLNKRFSQGTNGVTDEANVALSTLQDAWDLFRNDQINISLVIAGKPREATMANYIIDNIVEYRKDCVVFVSAEKDDVVTALNDEVDNLIEFRNLLRSSSYAFMDSGWKYQYDRYNDVNRYIPLCGDIAGLTSRSDQERDPWWSPAGLQRGAIKNLIRLAFSPNQAERDRLYQADINPVVTFPGEGTVLFGDKTLLGQSSAFSRINVRRLFIVLRKSIAKSARQLLFEFNDFITRAQFVNFVEPYLRDVQGRRGLTDFRVICDDTNNTPEVIDQNRFIGDIYLKPARSINFILLNFVAVRTGVDFSEVILGQTPQQ